MYEIWLVTFCWGLSFPLARILVAELDPLWITTFRFLIGGASLLLLSTFGRPRRVNIKRSWKLVLFLAVFEFFLTYFLYLTSIMYLPASKVAALTLSTPVLILIIDSVFKVRFPAFKIVLPFILALAGTVVLYDTSSPTQVFFSKQLIGFICIVLSNLSFATASVVMRRRSGSSAIRITGVAQLAAGAMALVTSLAWKGLPGSLSASLWMILIYLSVIATGVGFWFWNRSVNKLGALYPGLISNLKAPVAAILSVIILKEVVSIVHWEGIAFMVASACFAYTTIERMPAKDHLSNQGISE
jgi:drug/metabolite transporter (DMT)-like permease